MECIISFFILALLLLFIDVIAVTASYKEENVLIGSAQCGILYVSSYLTALKNNI